LEGGTTNGVVDCSFFFMDIDESLIGKLKHKQKLQIANTQHGHMSLFTCAGVEAAFRCFGLAAKVAFFNQELGLKPLL
jgi:hypothetical protein